jgi:predicted XRE-type DNA-binding protein
MTYIQRGQKMNKYIGSAFDDFLKEEGMKEEVENDSIKKIIAFQLQETIKVENLTKTELAKKLETSRAAVDRLLDPYNESVTLFTLKKAAAIVGKRIKMELV